MGLQSSTHKQVVREVCYVNAHDSKRIAVRKRSSNICGEFVFFQHTIRNTDDTNTADCVLLRCINSLPRELPRCGGVANKKNIYLLPALYTLMAVFSLWNIWSQWKQEFHHCASIFSGAAQIHSYRIITSSGIPVLLPSPLAQGKHSTSWLCLQGDPASGILTHLPNRNSLPTVRNIRFQQSVL